MDFKLKRFAFKADYTIGRLFCNGDYICDTMEPRSAGLSERSSEARIKAEKEKGKVAIPKGRYKVVMAISRRFHRMMPYVKDVPGFEGIMIHPGNYPKDTQGCILPGWNRMKGMVCGSRSAMEKLFDLISEAIHAGEETTLEIMDA